MSVAMTENATSPTNRAQDFHLDKSITHDDIMSWSVSDVGRWLTEGGLGDYCDIFRQEYIDGSALLELSEEDMEFLGKKLGHRKKVKHFIQSSGTSLRTGMSKRFSVYPPNKYSNECFPPVDGINENIPPAAGTFANVPPPAAGTNEMLQKAANDVYLQNNPASTVNAAVPPNNNEISHPPTENVEHSNANGTVHNVHDAAPSKVTVDHPAHPVHQASYDMPHQVAQPMDPHKHQEQEGYSAVDRINDANNHQKDHKFTKNKGESPEHKHHLHHLPRHLPIIKNHIKNKDSNDVEEYENTKKDILRIGTDKDHKSH